MTYDYELILIGETYTGDGIGNQIPTEAETTILCAVKSITRAEFYDATIAELKPEMVLVVHRYEYADQKNVIFDSKKYRVIRTYATGIEELELVCERVIGNG